MQSGPVHFTEGCRRSRGLLVGVFVDGLLVEGSDKDCGSSLKSLNEKFRTNNPGKCAWYDEYGIERDREVGTINLSQEAYVERMKIFDVPSTTDIPASPGGNLGPKRDDESGEDCPVREAFGSLLWLSTMTQPGTTNAVRAVARYAHTPTEKGFGNRKGRCYRT